MKRARRLLCSLLLATCTSATGCLIPYAYPKLDCVPGAHIGTTTSDVSVFRVDVTASQIDIGEEGSVKLTEIIPHYHGTFPTQFGASVERGYYVVGGALNFNVGRMHTTRVRLYRPGYQLVELPAWGLAKDVVWIEAPDWSAQEKAIDDLLSRPAVSASAAYFVKSQGSFWNAETQPRKLPEVSASPATTAVFVLAAAEYDRVAKLAPTPQDAARLHQKAKMLIEVQPAITPTVADRVPPRAP